MSSPITTIGIYGFTQHTFVLTLQRAGVTELWDIRQRRGIRGSQYSFGNSRQLQALMLEANIRYTHQLQLAPSAEIRELQKRADADASISKRHRSELSPLFQSAYRTLVLETVDPSLVLELKNRPKIIALLCVEASPLACHRSLAADYLASEIGAEVEHLYPCESSL